MIPQPFTLVLPVLATNIAAWLKDDGLPRWLNYLIIAIFFVAAVWASLVSEGHLTGDPVKDASIVIVECLAVFQTLQPVMARSTALAPSPLIALRQSGVATQGRASKAVAPLPIVLARRASLQASQPPMSEAPTAPMPQVEMPAQPELPVVEKPVDTPPS